MVFAAQHKVVCLIQGIRDCECLALYGFVSGFSCMREPATDQSHLSAISTAEWPDWREMAVLLEEPKSNALL